MANRFILQHFKLATAFGKRQAVMAKPWLRAACAVACHGTKRSTGRRRTASKGMGVERASHQTNASSFAPKNHWWSDSPMPNQWLSRFHTSDTLRWFRKRILGPQVFRVANRPIPQ